MTLLMRGCTSAGEMRRRFSTSSKICKVRGAAQPSWSQGAALGSAPGEGGPPWRLEDALLSSLPCVITPAPPVVAPSARRLCSPPTQGVECSSLPP